MRAQLLGFLLMMVAGLAQSEKLTLVTSPWPPFVDPALPGQGYALEIIRAAYASQGFEVELQFMPWARAEKGLKEGSYDLTPIAWQTEARKSLFDFSDAYALTTVRFIRRKGDPFRYSGLESLDGKMIGVVQSYTYSEAFSSASNFERSEANDLMQNVRRLVLNRIDLTLDDESVARALISRENADLLSQIEFVEQPLSVETLHVASGRANPRHTEVIEAFNRGLAAIKANGVYETIFKGLEKASIMSGPANAVK